MSPTVQADSFTVWATSEAQLSQKGGSRVLEVRFIIWFHVVQVEFTEGIASKVVSEDREVSHGGIWAKVFEA